MSTQTVQERPDRPLRIALIGDSILDNKCYTAGEPSVCEHLNDILRDHGSAVNLAVDGSLTHQVAAQLERIPAGTTHVVLSSGGNDALQYERLLSQPVGNTAEALALFRQPIDRFTRDYRKLHAAIADALPGLPVLTCTVYNGRYPQALADSTRVAIALFNDPIYAVAHEFSRPVLELRKVCTEGADYANPIEPSGSGGRKIARGIVRMLLQALSDMCKSDTQTEG